jgi:hypothetical protein
MEDVLEVYNRPYDSEHPLICMDEASKQLVKEVRAPISIEPGYTEKYDSEYERNGTANIFMMCEPLKGKRFTSVTDRRTKVDWAHEIKKLVDEHYSEAKKIVLVSDNLNTHAGSSLYEAFPPEEAKRIFNKLEFHFTPKHGSWLNIAEIELSHLSRQCLNRRIPDQKTLSQEVAAWTSRRNNSDSIVNWRFTTKDARIKLKKLYPEIIDRRN